MAPAAANEGKHHSHLQPPAAEDLCIDNSQSLVSLASHSTGASSLRSVRAPLEEGYEVKVSLGEGRYGTVREVVRKGSKERYAVKVMDCGPQSAAELRALSELRHKNIIRLHEAREHNGLAYLVMDLCEGGTLLQWISSRFEEHLGKEIYERPSSRQLGSFLWQTLDAVRYLHSCSIVHRDVKPQNLLVRRRGHLPELKLADFNLATVLHGESLTKCCGTPGFMAPEVVQGEYSELCDIWSTGVVFYQLTTGERLWRDTEATEEHFKELLARTPLTLQRTTAWKVHGEGAGDLAQEMLSTERQGRPSAAAAMEHSWLQKHALGTEHGCCTIS